MSSGKKLYAEKNIESLQKHLKLHYKLGCKFSYLNSSSTTVKKTQTLELTDSVLIRDLISHYSSLGVSIEIYNEQGKSIPTDLSLKEASAYEFKIDDDSVFDSLLASLDSISASSNYDDIEWIKRIFIQAIRKSKNEQQMDRVRLKLEQIFSENERFLKSDFEDIISRM